MEISVNTTGASRDEEYYMETVVFLVEDCLFKVPRFYFAQNSDIFEATFSLPQGLDVEGCSDDKPFKLEGVQKEDLRSLLRLAYPQQPLKGTPTLSLREWISVLKLSTMWNMLDMRKLAVQELSTTKIEPVEKVILGRDHKIPKWLISGYCDLIRRSQKISLEEAQKLGLEATVLLFHAREEIASTVEYNYGYRTRESQDFTQVVRKTFQEELKDVEAASMTYTSSL